MADVPVTIYKSRKVRPGFGPTTPDYPADEDPIVVNPPGSGLTTEYKRLGDVDDRSFIGKEGWIPSVVGEDKLQLVPLPQLQENGLISGAVVQWTGSGYEFNVSSSVAKFLGQILNSGSDTLTLTTPDATFDRDDLFVLDVGFDVNGIPNSLTPNFITGTPSATPIVPQIDPSYQIRLTSVRVTAASTEPTLTEEILYDDAAIWTGTSGGSGTVNFTSTADPCQGTNSIEVTSAQNATYIQFDYGSELDISPFQTFGFILKLKANMLNGQTIALGLYDGSMNAVISPIPLAFDKTSLDCQFVGIVLSGQPFVSLNVRYVRFQFIRFSGATTYLGFFLDMVKFEGGINPPVTVGLSGSGTAGEIAYFTASTALASLPVSTYPSIAELAHVKGVTSAIQGQINGKQATIAGTLTDGYVATIVAGVATWAAPSGGSNWTIIGSDVYRNSRVLIGTTVFTDTTAKLEISGRVSQVGLGGSTFFGQGSGAADDLTSNSNNAFGQNSLNKTTTGTNNCAFGNASLFQNLTGNDNSAFGRNALQNNTNSNNSAFGGQALQLNTSGGSNSAFGQGALSNNTIAGQSSAFGGRALFANTASFNNAFGYDALFSNSSGANNCAFGYLTLRSNSTASFNTAVGNSALNGSTGASNTAVGYRAMGVLTSGASNTAIGTDAGRQYGSGTLSNATCNNSVFLGELTRANNTGETNQIVIGYNALGAGSNSATLGNSSIILTILRGTVNMSGLPTASTGLNTGDVWNNGGVLNIV